MITLSRNTNYKREIIIGILPSSLIIILSFMIALKIPDFNLTFIKLLLLIAIIMYIYYLYKLITISTKPTAWIENNILYIRIGVFGIQKINKENLESIWYETNHWYYEKHQLTEGHKLHVKIKGYEDWEIPLFIHKEHVDNMRVYNFINDNFYLLDEPVPYKA